MSSQSVTNSVDNDTAKIQEQDQDQITDHQKTKPEIIKVHIFNIPHFSRWRQIKGDLLLPCGIAEETILHIQVFEDSASCVVSLNSENSANTLLSKLEGTVWHGFPLVVRTEDQLISGYDPIGLQFTPLINDPAYLPGDPNDPLRPLLHQQQQPPPPSSLQQQQQSVISIGSPQLQHLLPPIPQSQPQPGVPPPLPPLPLSGTSGPGGLSPGSLRFTPINPYAYTSNENLQQLPPLQQVPSPQLQQYPPPPRGYYAPPPFPPPIPINYESGYEYGYEPQPQRIQYPQRYQPQGNQPTPYRPAYTNYHVPPPRQHGQYYPQQPPQFQQHQPYYTHQRTDSSISSTYSNTKSNISSPSISSRALASLRQYPYQNITDFDRSIPDKTRLFIGNIPYTSEWTNLKDYLRTAGSITRVEIPSSLEGGSKGFAIATYENEQDAKKAIEMFNGVDFEGRPLTVRYDRFLLKNQVGSSHNTGQTANSGLKKLKSDEKENVVDGSKSGDVGVTTKDLESDSKRLNVKEESLGNSKVVDIDADKKFEDDARNLIESIKALQVD